MYDSTSTETYPDPSCFQTYYHDEIVRRPGPVTKGEGTKNRRVHVSPLNQTTVDPRLLSQEGGPEDGNFDDDTSSRLLGV